MPAKKDKSSDKHHPGKKMSPRSPKKDKGIGSRLDEVLDVYERAVELGIVTEDNNDSDEGIDDEEYEYSGMDTIASIITDSITAALTHGAEHHYKKIRIENEIIGNVVENVKLNGLEFSPEIAVINNMKGSLHNNNGAYSESGNVWRQNGVADFTNALRHNNNAVSTDGDVFRQNGIISSSNPPQPPPPGPLPPAGGAANFVEENARPASASSGNNANEELEEIVIINRFINNTSVRSKKNGLIVQPPILVNNDMSDALHHNNNAGSKTGDVRRQNGVADFTSALSYNNNAQSVKGDVVRQNGIVGYVSQEEAEVLLGALKGLLDLLEELVDLPLSILNELFGDIVNIIEFLVQELPVPLLLFVQQANRLGAIETEIGSQDAGVILGALATFLNNVGATEEIRELFQPLRSFLEESSSVSSSVAEEGNSAEKKKEAKASSSQGKSNSGEGNNKGRHLRGSNLSSENSGRRLDWDDNLTTGCSENTFLDDEGDSSSGNIIGTVLDLQADVMGRVQSSVEQLLEETMGELGENLL